jgi:hypothetical protein
MVTSTSEVAESVRFEQASTPLRYLENLGPDAAPYIKAFLDAPAAERGRAAAVWDGLGGTAGASYNSSLQGTLDGRTATKTVKVYGDMSAFDAAMAERTRQREVHIKVYEDNMGGRRQGMGTP